MWMTLVAIPAIENDNNCTRGPTLPTLISLAAITNTAKVDSSQNGEGCRHILVLLLSSESCQVSDVCCYFWRLHILEISFSVAATNRYSDSKPVSATLLKIFGWQRQFQRKARSIKLPAEGGINCLIITCKYSVLAIGQRYGNISRFLISKHLTRIDRAASTIIGWNL